MFGYVGGRAIVLVLNRLTLPQGLHAPFTATGAIVVFAVADVLHGSGFLAVYIAGLVVGNAVVRAHNSIVAFLDAATWLAQIAMFVLLGLLAWPGRLPQTILPALAVAATLMLVARPVAVFLCLAPFPFNWREKLFMSWVGLRGAVGIFIASIPLLAGVPNAQLYFDVGFVVVLVSLLVQGWTIAPAARLLKVAFPRSDPLPRRVELDLPGQLEQEIVGYPISANSPYLRRGLLPTWARPTLVVRDERILSPTEAKPVRQGDYVYLLAPPEKAQALDRFFVDMPPPARPDPLLLGRLLRHRRPYAGRTRGDLRAHDRAGGDRDVACRLHRGAHRAHAARRRRGAARSHRAGGEQGQRGPRRQHRSAAGGGA